MPRAGEPGVETWEGESWKNRSGTNAWSFLTVDVERGLVFAPTGSPTSDFYGGDRKGQNLYGNSLIALDAATGKLKWFQQLVHHDIWDWDLPAAPTLIDVKQNGRTIPAVAQITKMSTLFIFDRVTGEPLFGLEERPVPQSDVPGESDVADAAVPARAAAAVAHDVRSRRRTSTRLRPSTPPTAGSCGTRTRCTRRACSRRPALDGTMVTFPSTLGGGNWSGLSYDPTRGLVFTNIMNLGQVARMEPRHRSREPGEVRLPARRTPWGGADRPVLESGDARFRARRRRSASWSPSTSTAATVAWRVPLGVFDD